MDPIENKLREYFQKKRQEDARAMPDFETVWRGVQSQKSRRRVYPFLRIAAAVATGAIAITGYLYFKGSQPAIGDHQLSGTHSPLPPTVLGDKTFATEYIWTWKAPTDQLLNDVNQSLKQTRNEKL